MSTVKANNVQIGQSVTATNNFVISVPAAPDGTMKIARGNQGATTQDVLSVDASGAIVDPIIKLGGTTGTAGQVVVSQGAGQAPSWGNADPLPSQTGNGGKFLSTNGTDTSWDYVATQKMGEITMFSSGDTANTRTFTDGATFLKTGVVVSRADAVSAGYDVTGLEEAGMSAPARYTSVTGLTGTIMTTAGGGVFLAMTYGGSVVKRSTDGITWATVTTGSSGPLYDVQWLNNRFVLLGTSWLGESADGLTWTPRTCPSSGTVKYLIRYIDGRYLTWASASNLTSWSADLISWSTYTAAAPTAFMDPFGEADGSYHCAGAASGIGVVCKVNLETGVTRVVFSDTRTTSLIGGLLNGLYIVLGAGGTGTAYCATSTDAVTWTYEVAPPARAVEASTRRVPPMAYGNGVYVTSNMWSSTGKSWTNSTGGASLPGVVFLNGLFISYAGAEGIGVNLYTSTDGATWTPRSAGTVAIYHVIYALGLYIACGGTNSIDGYIHTSTDGVTWTSRLSHSQPLVGLAELNGVVVAVDYYGSVWSSTNGTTWTPQLTISEAPASRPSVVNSRFLFGTGTSSRWSFDGVNWFSSTSRIYKPSAAAGILGWCAHWRFFNGVYYGIGGYGGSASPRSTDLATWTLNYVVSPTQLCLGTTRMASSGDRLWCAVVGGTNNDNAAFTVDGINWTSVYVPGPLLTTEGANYIAAGDGAVVFNRQSTGTLYATTNGFDWTVSTPHTTTVSSLTYGNNIFWSTNTTAAATSTDGGVTWKGCELIATPTGSAYGAGVFMAADTNGGTQVSTNGVSGVIGKTSLVSVAGVTTFVRVK